MYIISIKIILAVASGYMDTHTVQFSSVAQSCLTLCSCMDCSMPGFPAGSVVKNPPTMQETWVRSLGQEDPLEKEMANHSSILAWKIPWMGRGAWWATIYGVTKSWT